MNFKRTKGHPLSNKTIQFLDLHKIYEKRQNRVATLSLRRNDKLETDHIYKTNKLNGQLQHVFCAACPIRTKKSSIVKKTMTILPK